MGALLSRAPLVAALLLAAASPAAAQATVAASWEAGFEEAKARNVPVLVALGKDARVLQGLQNPALARLLDERVVIVVGHRPGGHEPVEQVDPRTREKRLACPLFPTIACEVHDAVYNDKAGLFDYQDLPAAFLLRPDGGTAEKNVERLGPKDLPAKLDELQRALGPGTFRSEIARLEHKLSKGDAKLDKGHLKGARKVYEKEQEKADEPYLSQMVATRLEALDARALELIEAARQEGDAGALKRIAREMKGRAPAEAAEAALGEVEK